MGRASIFALAAFLFIAGASKCSYSCAKIGACETLCCQRAFWINQDGKCMCEYSHGWELKGD